ncbi:MAG TPA: choice-of-anchor D domain-containing protein, partial [Solirubrobacteraceae bacterium]
MTLLGVLLGATPAGAQQVSALPPAIQAGGLTPSPALLQFGQTGIHYGDDPREPVTFSNESSSPANIMSVGVDGEGSSSFQLVYDSCANQIVWPGNGCTVEVQFQPSQLGEQNAILTLELMSGEGTVEVPLAGTGSSGTPTADPSSLSFAGIPYTQQNGREESQNETEQVNVESLRYGTQIESVSIVGPDA